MFFSVFQEINKRQKITSIELIPSVISQILTLSKLMDNNFGTWSVCVGSGSVVFFFIN